jgi:hypothetical protein
MNKECKIMDDNEILEEEKNRFNFRRFKPEELEKKYSPFERTKKEFPFLFQKKREVPKGEHKISLEDIISQVKDLSFSSPELNAIRGNINEDMELSPHTPLYPPHSPCVSPMPELNLDDTILKDTSTMKQDE